MARLYLRAGGDLHASTLVLLVLGQRDVLRLLWPILQGELDGLLLDHSRVPRAHRVDDALVDGPQLHAPRHVSVHTRSAQCKAWLQTTIKTGFWGKNCAAGS